MLASPLTEAELEALRAEAAPNLAETSAEILRGHLRRLLGEVARLRHDLNNARTVSRLSTEVFRRIETDRDAARIDAALARADAARVREQLDLVRRFLARIDDPASGLTAGADAAGPTPAEEDSIR